MVVGVNVINNLLFTIEVDGAAHNYQRGVERVLEAVRVALIEEVAGSLDNEGIDALLLSLVVDAHVAEHAEAQLTHHSVVLSGKIVDSVLSRQQS